MARIALRALRLDAVWLLVPGLIVGLAGYTLTIKSGQRPAQA